MFSWNKIKIPLIAAIIFFPAKVFAHVSEQGLALLLPTDFYIASGTLAVLATLLVISLVPDTVVLKLYAYRLEIPFINLPFAAGISLLSTAFLFALIYIGFFGPNDPTKNLMPLVLWTLWWQLILIIQALFGNLWHWINPWTGIYRLICGSCGRPGIFKLNSKLGSFPGIIVFFFFTAFELTDIAPDDPERLAIVVLAYWLFTMLGMLLYGSKDWLARVECFTILLRFFALLSMFAVRERKFIVGFPGWRLVNSPVQTFSGGVFAILILANGSFDGLNETFWWLEKIGINPLLFPGRSAVIQENLAGLLMADLLLPLCFIICIFIGIRLTNKNLPFRKVTAIFSVTVLPIAVGYHFSHYLTAFMVNIQYTVVAFSDPINNGSDYLHLGTFYVTSGFLNSHHTVQAIWLSQAAAVVAGHIIAVLISHCLAVKLFPISRESRLVQIPLSIFMMVYTVFGLWLLASPRGL